MSRSPAEVFRGSIRWLPATAIFALAPKCLVCLAAYAGVGAALGVKLGGPEICGASTELLAGPVAWFTMLIGAVGAATFLRWRRCLAVRGSCSDCRRDLRGRSSVRPARYIDAFPDAGRFRVKVKVEG